MAPEITTFSGPLTAVAITNWLIACEKAFGTAKLTDADKVKQAGARISPDSVTRDLAEWWKDNEEITTWTKFKDGIKNEALGTNWRVRALKAFYTTKQEGTSVKEYVESLEANRSVIDQGAGQGDELQPINDFTFKCYMLFNAAPAITAKIMNDGFDIVGTSAKELGRKIIRSAPKSVSGASSLVKSPASTGGYILLDPWGTNYRPFSDIDSLPFLARDLGPTTKVTIWSNNVSTKYMIQRYRFDFLGSNSASNTPAHDANIARELGLADGEYIASVTFTSTIYNYRYTDGVEYSTGCKCLSSMAMMTSGTPPRTISLSGDAAIANKALSSTVETTTFKAPSGWRIVGFRGSNSNYQDWDIGGQQRYPIVGLGAILAPVSA